MSFHAYVLLRRMYVVDVGIAPSINLIRVGTGVLFMLELTDNMNASPA
jgi:hypothetical protein